MEDYKNEIHISLRQNSVTPPDDFFNNTCNPCEQLLLFPEDCSPNYEDCTVLPNLDNPPSVEDLPDRSIKLLSRRSFVFHPSFLDTYTILKTEYPELALQYLEALISYGVDAIAPPKNVILYGFLQSPIASIDKSYEKYLIKRTEERHNEYEVRETQRIQIAMEQLSKRNRG